MERTEWINSPISQQQRIEIMLRAERKENDTQIGTAMRLSRSVVRKWRRKARDRGVEGADHAHGKAEEWSIGSLSERNASGSQRMVYRSSRLGCRDIESRIGPRRAFCQSTHTEPLSDIGIYEK